MKKYFAVLLLVAVYLAPVKAQAGLMGLEGDEIDAAMIRTINDPVFGVGRICCFGLDAPFVVANGSSDQKQYSSAFLLDVDNFSFSIDYIGFGGWQNGIVLRLSDLDFNGGSTLLAGLDIDTNVSGLTWDVGSDYIDLNIGNTRLDSGLFINGNFLVSDIPEPSIIVLMGLGFFGLGLVRRKVRT